MENNNLEEQKKKYFYGDKYKGRYKDTLHKNYLNKKERMTDEDKQKLKEYHQERYKQNKDKYLENSKKQNKKVKEALNLLKQIEQGVLTPSINNNT